MFGFPNMFYGQVGARPSPSQCPVLLQCGNGPEDPEEAHHRVCEHLLQVGELGLLK